MDASGLVVAASETIRFEKGLGIILITYNICLDIHFYVLVKENLVRLWKRVLVNHFYKFSYLKLGAIELLSGARKVLLVTTSKSEFFEIEEHELEEDNISRNVMEKISVPGITFKSEIHSFSQLISYEGIITEVKNSRLGLYELDNKIHLYCIFNSFHTSLPPLREGFEIFVSNAHFFTDFKGRKILVCCGLSSVRCMESEEEIDEASFSVNYNQYPLSIFDVIWLEMLLRRLNTNFCPSLISNNIFYWESEIMFNILESFSYTPEGVSVPHRQNLSEEFCSNPHSCDIFCDDILPTGCEIFNISKILDNAFSNVTWTDRSDTWKTSVIPNQSKFILIGILYLSKNGCFYIMDRSCSIPVVLTQSCTQCKCQKNFFCSFDDLNLGYLVVVQNFDVVFEKIRYNCNNICYRYLKTSCCYLFYLGTFHKQDDNTFHHVSVSQESFYSELKLDSCIDEVSNSLNSILLDKEDLWTTEKENVYDDEGLISDSFQKVLVLNKIWTVVGQKFVCYQVAVLLFPQNEINEDCFDRSKSLFDEYSSYHENDYDSCDNDEGDDDDEEFAELVNQMDSLYLEDKPRLARLHFESARQCASLLPGHIYVIDLCEDFCKEQFANGADKNHFKTLIYKIKSSTKILHHPECLGNHDPDDFEVNIYCSVKQVISERKVRDNCLVQAVLKEKLFEESNCISQGGTEGNLTFCLIVRDCNSDDTIKVYLPVCPKNMYGFLPGICLHMYGFVCVCSKRGNFYLKPSSSFAIQIVNTEEFHRKDISYTSKPEDITSADNLKISTLRGSLAGDTFKCIGYIIKIVSVKLYLMCNICASEFEEKCDCFSNYSIKLTMSFIIDDGTEQMLASCCDETARKVLMLTENEWEKLVSHITKRKTCLKFHYKFNENYSVSSPVVDQVFSVYCSSTFLCREVLLKCRRVYDGSKNDQQTIWCYDVLQMHEKDLIPEFIAKVKTVDSQNI